jgi:hypothetical protein
MGGALSGLAIESGIGRGRVVVRKWYDPDYFRLRDEEVTQRAKLLKAGAGKGHVCVTCEITHSKEAHITLVADKIALAVLAVKGIKPYGVAYGKNAYMRATGNNALWRALTGIAVIPTLYNNANAYTGVGDSATAVAVTQTDLQAAVNKVRRAMVATYPQINASPNDNQVVFRSDYLTTFGEYAWIEFATFNAAAAGDMFNRGLFSPSPGTKGAGVTWTLTETLTNT